MDKILHYFKYPKLWELWYVPFFVGSAGFSPSAVWLASKQKNKQFLLQPPGTATRSLDVMLSDRNFAKHLELCIHHVNTLEGLLGGSWVVISRVISPLI